MKTLLAFITLTIPTFLIGQVTLDSASIIPGIGDTVDYYIVDKPGSFAGPGAAGVDQVWDFSAMKVGDSTDAEFEGPRGGLQSDPANTNLCEQYTGFTGTRTQYKSSPNDLYIMGTRSGITQLSYGNDSLLKFKFPVKYTNTQTSNYYFTSGGISNTKRSGSYKVTVDGWGAMFLPYGGLNDILRVKIEANYNDTTGRFRPRFSVYSSTTYEFWQKGTGNYVMSVKYEDDDGSLDTVITYRKGTQVVVSEVDTTKEDTTFIVNVAAKKKLQLYPNPASDKIQVNAPGISADTKVHLVNLTGSFRDVVEFQNGSFDISEYPNGFYILMIEGNAYEPIRFIKQE